MVTLTDIVDSEYTPVVNYDSPDRLLEQKEEDFLPLIKIFRIEGQIDQESSSMSAETGRAKIEVNLVDENEENPNNLKGIRNVLLDLP